MELGEFLNDPIAPLLERDFVEARLHTDGSTNVARILELQQHYVGDVGLPTYVVVDPADLASHGRYRGACLTAADVRRFAAFLEAGAQRVRG